MTNVTCERYKPMPGNLSIPFWSYVVSESAGISRSACKVHDVLQLESTHEYVSTQNAEATKNCI